MRPPERAMVLAAGLGQRLRPLTACFAKPALPLLGTSLLEYSLRRLLRSGVGEAVVNLHHLPESLEPVLARSPAELVVHRSEESELLGTAGGLKRAQGHLAGGPFLVLNGDTIFDFDLDALIETHVERRAEATLVLRTKTGGTHFSTVSIDAAGRISGIDARDRGPGLMFAGVWLMEPSLLETLSGRPKGLEVELLPRLIERGSAFASVQNGPFVTIDTPFRYWSHSMNVARDGLFEADWSVRRHSAHLLVGEATRVAPSARFEGTVILGRRCRVGKGARLRNVICWDDVQVPAGARLEDAIVTDGVRLSRRAEFVGKILMNAPADSTFIRRRELNDGLVVASLDVGRARGLAARS